MKNEKKILICQFSRVLSERGREEEEVSGDWGGWEGILGIKYIIIFLYNYSGKTNLIEFVAALN
jgi:hypothetical protein